MARPGAARAGRLVCGRLLLVARYPLRDLGAVLDYLLEQRFVDAVVAALQAGARPTDVAEHSPFTDTYVRRIARQNGLAPRKKGAPPDA